ncbi:GIY-YIG nuclease family protein [Flavobacterium sp. W22_SRS_FK3]|uniref:GIY-YIG nuclease family protein n=1 Tax=Flavobacterium sp. W22_SRS_FK3 TaxID=3240275 RepID=UPI003F911024
MKRRLNEHNLGLNIACYTFDKRPLELVFHTEFNELNQAIAFEKTTKRMVEKRKKL